MKNLFFCEKIRLDISESGICELKNISKKTVCIDLGWDLPRLYIDPGVTYFYAMSDAEECTIIEELLLGNFEIDGICPLDF